MDKIVACETCGLVQNLPDLPLNSVAVCARCDSKLHRRLANSRTRTLVFSLAALFLYFPANLYPLVTANYQGQHPQTTVFQGIKALFEHHQNFIAGLVFCTSILTPALKILALLFISLTLGSPRWRKGRTRVYQVIRVIDPWNMLEVFLLAIGVSMIEMGEIAAVHPGRGVFSFAAVVVLTLFATLSFDPRLLWEPSEGENDDH